ncbi:MAG: ABC transporter ATP-binding protein, partial [Pseudomonadota bacterium]|nr:ABC transporter ATP-binding protein [Pseudomonadota bacterium]
FGVPPSERRTAEILDLIDLTDKAGAYARTLSGGMRRRLLIGKALVHAPPVLILDEPTAGVDIELRQRLWDNVRELNRAGMTILLTTHYLEEAEQLCDWIAIINHGRLIAAEPKATILARLDQKDVVATVRQDLSDWPLPAALVALAARVVDRHRLRISYRPREIPVQGILAALTGAGLDLVDIATHESDLEDIFLDLTRGADPPPAP